MGTIQGIRLEDQLRAKTRTLSAKLSPAIVATLGRSSYGFATTSAVRRALREGDWAPDFTLPNAAGEFVHLSTLRGYGPVVLSFYRGGWCPYCSAELKALEEVLPDIESLGASLIGISPEAPEFVRDTTTKNELTFEVLSDSGNGVARLFGLTYRLPEDVHNAYGALGIDFEQRNGDASHELPLAGTYVVDQHGLIQYAFVRSDFRKRAEPEEVLNALRNLVH